MGTAHVFDIYAEVGAPPEKVLAVGGGTKNAVWMQATSDLSGARQLVCERTLGASYGDAFLAAVAVGAAVPKDIARWNPVVRSVPPEEVPAYRCSYPLWQDLYRQTRGIAHALDQAARE